MRLFNIAIVFLIALGSIMLFVFSASLLDVIALENSSFFYWVGLILVFSGLAILGISQGYRKHKAWHLILVSAMVIVLCAIIWMLLIVILKFFP